MKSNPKQIVLRHFDGHTYSSYLELWHHPHNGEECGGIVKKSVALNDLIADYTGPRISIDFDAANNPIGIEILYSYGEYPPDDSEDDDSN